MKRVMVASTAPDRALEVLRAGDCGGVDEGAREKAAVALRAIFYVGAKAPTP
jgi:hypothetical protein